MPPTTGYSFGDVVSVPFAFTNRAGSKKHPAVIISSVAYNSALRDLVIRRLGRLSTEDQRALRIAIAKIVGQMNNAGGCRRCGSPSRNLIR